jgi:hypothetical protein
MPTVSLELGILSVYSSRSRVKGRSEVMADI